MTLLVFVLLINRPINQQEITPMLRTLEAVIDNHNHVQWLEHVQLHSPQRVLITLLDSAPNADETLLMAEPALEEWLNDDEEAAWAHLQPEA